MALLTQRGIVQVARAQDVVEGAGVLVHRALPQDGVDLAAVDPFLLLDVVDLPGDGPAFPPHPHRGFEIVTYVTKGSGFHKDDFGNQAVIRAGGLMRVTAGRGMTHSESREEVSAESQAAVQMWINLPAGLKNIAPEFQAVGSNQVPEKAEGGATLRFLAGEGSQVPLKTPALYREATLRPGGAATLEIPGGYQGYVLVLEGEGDFGAGDTPLGPLDLGILGTEGGLKIQAAGVGALRFLLAAGQPLRQPIRWRGPFVD